jgi:hypothetical protein
MVTILTFPVTGTGPSFGPVSVTGKVSIVTMLYQLGPVSVTGKVSIVTMLY